MRDVFAAVAGWLRSETSFALATLVDVRWAAPAPLGASMAACVDGTIVGDIGAGCYEGEIIEALLETARDGNARTLSIDLSDDDVLNGGSGCGGILEIVTWRPAPEFCDVADAIVAGSSEVTFPVSYECDGRPHEFIVRVPARRELLIVGGTTLAREIAAIAARLEFRTVVIDPRPAFATPERLPLVDDIVVAWPEEALPPKLTSATPLLVLSHDPKLDIPALRAGLASDAPYIGLLGSRRTQRARRAALREEGLLETALARIHGPAGLDLGGTSAAETALSILAEIVAVAHARSGDPLVSHNGAIHAASPKAVASAGS